MSVLLKCKKDPLLKEVALAKKVGLYPYFLTIEENSGSKIVINGKEIIMIGSNNYLGLSFDPRVIEASINATKKYGTSCSGSRLLNGTLSLHEELENELAKFVCKQAALCFTTGYQSNLGAISALIAKDDHVFTDRYNHASINDGISLAKGYKGIINVHRYMHNSPDSLERALSKVPLNAPKIILTDGVFSMEGDILKLNEIKKLADKYKACLYLDEAHALGVLGKTGRGTEEHFGVKNSADLIMGTFSKSLGSVGGFVAGDKNVIEYIKHHSRPMIFSASLPPACVAAALKSLEIIQKEPERIHRLQNIGKKMIKGFTEMGYVTGATDTPIVPIVIGKRDTTLKFWKKLLKNNFYTNTVVPPAVPSDRTLIRTSYMAIHQDEELDKALDIFQKIGKQLKLIQ